MGKYQALKGKIEPFRQDDVFQAKVNEAKTTYQAIDSPELARIFGMLRSEKQSLDDKIKQLNVHLEAASQLLVEQLDASGLQKIQLATGETCYTQMEPYSSVENRDELVSYLKKHKMQSMLVPQWQSINAFNKDLALQGKPFLPGTRVYIKTSARLRGGNQNQESE